MTKGVTFYFVRHGETYLNRLGRFQGWADAPLTPEGLEIVHQSGRGLADVKFDAVYTSDLGRTIKTAQILLEENHHSQDLTITPMPEFREVFFGYYEGLEAQSVWRDMIAETNHELGLPRDAGIQVEATMNKMKASDPTGLAENYLEFWHRVETGLLELLNRHAGSDQTILVVCHGLTIQNLIHGLVADFELGEPLANASVTTVKYLHGQFQLIAYNQTEHFKDMVDVMELL